MKAPNYLQPVLSGTTIENDYQVNGTLSPGGNQQFYILTHGRIEEIDQTLYLMPDDDKKQTYLQISIQPLDSHKQYLVYNGRIHGYDNLFCEQHTVITEPLKKNRIKRLIRIYRYHYFRVWC